jgi:hypothetical protein
VCVCVFVCVCVRVCNRHLLKEWSDIIHKAIQNFQQDTLGQATRIHRVQSKNELQYNTKYH